MTGRESGGYDAVVHGTTVLVKNFTPAFSAIGPYRYLRRILSLLSPVFLLLAIGLSPAAALQISGLESPQSFVADPATTTYFISNINGDPTARDNNGFITKLNGNAEIVGFKFIAGGQNGTTLNAPKGMAIVNETLYVADVDTLRAFNTHTGQPVAAVVLAAPQSAASAISLIDVAAGNGGLLYVSDLPGNTIYQIDIQRNHRVSVLVHDPRLAGPAGLAVHPKTGRLIVVSWQKGSIMEVTPEGTITELVSNSFFTSRFQRLSGVDFDRWGNMYVSDPVSGKVWRMLPDKRFQVIAEYLPAPADIGVDRVNNLILVPYQDANGAEVNGLEAPVGSRGDAKKRTLADYGFVAPPKTDKSEPSPK